MTNGKNATLYRMVLPEETCPFGVRAKQLLNDNGFTTEEHVLRSRDEVEAVKKEMGVATTPVVFIGDKQIGGSEELEHYLAKEDPNA